MDDFGNMYISYFNSSRSTNVLKVNLPQPLFLNSIKNDLLNEELTISPNPATDYITININGINPTLKRGGEGDVFVGIYDIMGILVSNTPSSVFNGQTGASDLPRIDISNLSPGVYFVKIIGSNGAYSSVEKFVKY